MSTSSSTPNPQPSTPFARLAEVSGELEGLRGRNAMADLAGGFLRGLAPEEIAPATRMLIGRPFAETDPRTLDVSWAAVWSSVRRLVAATREETDAVFGAHVDAGGAVEALLHQHRTAPVDGPPLGLIEVHRALEAIAAESGPGSRERKEAALLALFRRASPAEGKQLAKIVLGDMRHGLSEGVLLDALARTTGIARARVARANQLAGDLGELARTLLLEGEADLAGQTLRLYRPLKPMLAENAADVAEAWSRLDGQLAL